MFRFHRTILIVAATACLAGSAAHAQRKAITLDPEMAKLLAAAQADLGNKRPDQAVQRLVAFKGKDDHALRYLILGHAYLRQDKLTSAGAAYRKALDMDANLTDAGLALAQILGRQEKWSQAAKLLGRHAAPDACGADVLFLYAQVAHRMDDGRLCTLLTRKGIVRFPGDLRFRRLELALLADTSQHAAMQQSVMLLLRTAPADATLWQHLAYSCDRAGNSADALAALEALVLCRPADMDARQRLLAGHLAGGDWLAGVALGRSLLAGPYAKLAAASTGVMDLLIRAADMGSRDDILSTWLARVGDESHTRAMRLAAAKLALRRSEPAQARAALDKLIGSGETDPAVFVWAGHLAQRARDYPRAEALYTQARRLKGDAARTATLYLARLYITLKRLDQAARLLGAYLASHPADSPARAMLALVNARRASP